MKVSTVTALGVAAPLVLSCSASADVSLWVVKKDISGFEQLVSLVANVYAMFDGSDSATNFLTGIGGLPGGREGSVHVVDGVFFQSGLNTNNGGRTAPPAIFIPMFPELAVDSFVTIGYKADPGTDATGLTPNFPTEDGVPQAGGTWGPTRLTIDDGAWFVTPDDLQGHVGNADNGSNKVLIGQFSIAAGSGPFAHVFGTLRVQGVNNGEAFVSLLSFDNDLPAPGALWLMGPAALLGVGRRRRSHAPGRLRE